MLCARAQHLLQCCATMAAASRPTWLSSDWQMMAVPAGLGVMAGMECMDGSAMYLQDSTKQSS